MYVTAKINLLKIYLYNVEDVNMEDIYNICSNGMKRVIMSVRKLIVLVIVFDFYINTDDFLDFFIFWIEGFFRYRYTLATFDSIYYKSNGTPKTEPQPQTLHNKHGRTIKLLMSNLHINLPNNDALQNLQKKSLQSMFNRSENKTK